MSTLEIIFEILISILAHLGKQFYYFLNIQENVMILQRKLEELSAHEEDIKTQLQSAKSQHKKNPKKEVEVWVKNVDRIKDEVSTMGLGEDIRCLKGYVPNYLWRFNLGKLVVKKIKEVDEFQEKGQFSGGLFVECSSADCDHDSTSNVLSELKRRAMDSFQKRLKCPSGIRRESFGTTMFDLKQQVKDTFSGHHG
ncbi:uncharacterized protein LOC131220379 [Magnolia sinica]|uniref:uncharacterized protein LOC131220379 n=1 Tax=Magnolia sinica TaxID=86752 RepID=UPI002657F665|nr:uncharacterized protein LOC131220379 [Magnolia sinica]